MWTMAPRLAMARVLALACAARAFSPAAGGAARPRAGPLSLFGLGGGDSRYGALVADVAEELAAFC